MRYIYYIGDPIIVSDLLPYMSKIFYVGTEIVPPNANNVRAKTFVQAHNSFVYIYIYIIRNWRKLWRLGLSSHNNLLETSFYLDY